MRGGKTGQLVVVVPSEANESTETVQEWVVVSDAFSQYTVPSPFKGRAKTATVFKNTIHVFGAANSKLWHRWLESPGISDSRPALYRTDSARDAQNATQVCRVAGACAACALYSDSVVLVGTEQGCIFRVRLDVGGGSHEKIFQSEDGSDGLRLGARRIEAMAVMPGGDLVFSQGKQLMVAQGASLPQPDVSPPSSLVTLLRQLVFEGGVGAEIELDVKGDCRRVYGLRGILAARSPFFQAALSNGFREGAESHIMLSDTSFEALRCVVLYLHTEVIEFGDEFAMDVVELARRLDLPWLLNKALSRVKAILSAENWVKTLHSSERHNLPQLREFCMTYASKNIKEIGKQRDFNDLPSEKRMEIFEAI
uniref:BTB domain-containing protein n=1 Tax=Chromera velia CCMP2878 TaxID=1169474 RepID=A0A0G4HNE3_9ALVE|eukprot:Cvel_7618.t1-p1 / transcript=Cvel_7618.t1 / gene=Cvel_7618 / organism=Chromera_velia_CCMP2878 / gene_product=BTB/POZ domain-containing protein At4g08455, putative / transcript_product=BTB/POZ domain-containing protein At4g08455, putative / location=Cvel_scaffold402:21259-22922(+) / protein_length=366 / sequence_SO=supercontig / SO=protein_coding / is_pseudo=false